MTMKQPEKSRLSGLLVVVVVVVVVFMSIASPVAAQWRDRNSTLLRYYCSLYQVLNPKYFLSNLNSTLSSLRQQLTTSGDAVAHALFNGESVWGGSWCRGYLSVADCLACFDYAVDQLKVCGLAVGGSATYSDCDVRYENDDFFYNYYNIHAEVQVCGKTTSSQPLQFQKAVQRLLLDLQIVAPKTTSFFAASTRKVIGGNTTVYAIAQCNLNASHSLCLECLEGISKSLYMCPPSISGQAVDNICFMRYDTTPFFRQNQTIDITPLLRDGYSRKMRYKISTIIGGVSLFLLVLAFLLWRHRQKMTNGGTEDKVTLKEPELEKATYYNFKYLELATNNFSEENMIGKGGFGEVFKAILDDKKVVAVKKLKGEYAKAKVEFENEILLISQIRHRNLLRLLGWSSQGSELLLVLEYMQNGSLDKFLWGAYKGTLNWKTRYNIILGIAQGLAHLHKEFVVTIVHRDIKSSNILLDDNFQPKIADFGLARFQPDYQSLVTTKFAGTLGYTSPEYILYGHLSDKVDIFSFGIVILQIISGRKCTYRNFDGTSTHCLMEYAWELYETKNLLKLVDETIDVNQYKDEHVMNTIEIALLCTQTPASRRPTMSEVVSMLLKNSSSGERQLIRPNFIDHDWRIQVRSS